MKLVGVHIDSFVFETVVYVFFKIVFLFKNELSDFFIINLIYFQIKNT
jgi:hypothetical protein